MIITLQTLLFFRESLLKALDRLLRPYYKHFSLGYYNGNDNDGDDESDEHVFADFDEEKGVVFFPPMYAQRYAAVSDCLMDERWLGKIQKVVDIGYHDMSFIKYLKEVPGVTQILGVDIETIPLRCSSDLLGCEEYIAKRENPLQITLYEGNAADPDYRLIGCDAVIGIEMIEHMLPHDLDRLVHTVFGFIRPWIVIFTTPNADFNVLFKALEKNGLRRLDHLFEWSREQFNDWCSNIVVRYPGYTVSCRGIGPGPSGTVHYGCCSQMALFVSKDYQKQEDLNINSLALVAKAPSPNNLSEMIANLESPDNLTEAMICQDHGVESLSEFPFPLSVKHSYTTVMLSPSSSLPTLDFDDKSSQCNLDKEVGRNFIMFDDELMFNTMVPRKRKTNRVYLIEDVSSRLNCTTCQVKKFSKATQNLMAKNKIGSLVHTREVVDEIRHLTKSLNFKKDNNLLENGEHVWHNINWGDNAPYWNQFYKVVREYTYPFETKSEECRIIDLISDEINRLIDAQCDDEFTVDVSRLEIPLQHLMRTVEHITDDVDKVKDLLEWNGYEVVEDVVIHSRLVLDSASAVTHDDDWPDNDTASDWDTTDVHSTTVSDGSNFEADCHGHCLRRALDQKVRKLRTMMTADEDVTTELDRVVCRLMKLALRSSRGRQNPPCTRWMQCKLLDLLTLTEKAIERRKRHFIETYPLKAMDYYESRPAEIIALDKIKGDDAGANLFDKYRHLLQTPDKTLDGTLSPEPQFIEFELEDDLVSITSNEFIKDYEYIDTRADSPITTNIKENSMMLAQTKTKLERTQAWVTDDIEVAPYPIHDMNFDNVSSGDTDHSVNNVRYKQKRNKKYRILNNRNLKEVNNKHFKRSHSKTLYYKQKIKRNKNKRKSSSAKISKNLTHKILNRRFKRFGNKNEEYENYFIEYKQRNNNDLEHLFETTTSPIPESNTEVCPPKTNKESTQNFKASLSEATDLTNDTKILINPSYIAATKESLLINIITADAEETIALRRTVGVEADNNLIDENEIEIRSVSNELYRKHHVSTENVLSQTIFLNDINEPSTSKGIRHISMDVQCGPEVTPCYSALSTSTSLVNVPDISAIGVKMKALFTDIQSTDFSHSTQNNIHYETVSPRMVSVGIKIRDSDVSIDTKAESSIMTQTAHDSHKTVTVGDPQVSVIANNFTMASGTKLIKPISSKIKMEDSFSDLYESVGSVPKSSLHFEPTFKSTSNVFIESNESKNLGITTKFNKYVRPILSRGGIHVHSYRDKQVSEDVVYQGEWQRCRPKALAGKKSYNHTSRKVIDSAFKKTKVISKEKITFKNLDRKEIKLDQNKLLPGHIIYNAKRNKMKQETAVIKEFTIPTIVKNIYKVQKLSRHAVNSFKVGSKVTTSSVASKNVKFSHTKKTMPTTAMKTENNKTQKTIENYLPLYLKNKKQAVVTKKNSLNKSIESVNALLKMNKTKPQYSISPLVRLKNEEIKKELLRFPDEPRENISYIVLCNGKDETKDTNEQSTHIINGMKKQGSLTKQVQSCQSPDSSTCSSPNSIATVRAATTKNKDVSARRHSISSHKNILIISESESSTPNKNKKFAKRYKNANELDNKDKSNKENLPEQSTKGTDDETFGKSAFIGKHKNVYIAQLKTDSSHLQFTPKTLSKHQSKAQVSNKSNNRIPTQLETTEKKRAASPPISRKRSSKLSTLSNEHKNSGSSPESSNMVLVLEPHQVMSVTLKSQNISLITPDNNMKIRDNHLRTEWMQCSNEIRIDNNFLAMQSLIEEILVFIDSQFDSIDFISRDDENEIDMNASPTSIKTVVNNEDVNNSHIGENNVLNSTFDSILGNESIISLNNTNLTVTDLDFLSVKSVTSGKYSEYFLADDVYTNAFSNSNSVKDIFERKDHNLIQSPPGVIAVQAFSGFSIAGEPVGGDQPDPISIIDSETGSGGLDITRQATSEEIFVSGRSSDSYESCVIDEDAVVPNWLFNIISQQQSVVVEESEPQLPVIPLPDQLYDGNGNVVEQGIVGAGAGAGDGRGMHSDHSQDSSGRGTSLSSSEVSSDPQSEAILIDPSAFAHEYELAREPTDGVVPTTASDSTINLDANEDSGNVTETSNAGRNVRVLRPLLAATSDIDADISSIDTDVPDSSDN